MFTYGSQQYRFAQYEIKKNPCLYFFMMDNYKEEFVHIKKK